MPSRSLANTLLLPRYEHRILGLMLIALHMAIWFDFGGALSRSLMLAHLGLFLLWQPVWRREQHLDTLSGVFFVAGTFAFVGWMNWELITIWVVLLTGMVGGRVTSGRSDRYAYLSSLVFLVCEILLGCIPQTFDISPLQRDARVLFSYGLLAMPIGLLIIPGRHSLGRNPHSVDFLYGLTTSLLVCVLSMGSLLAMYLGETAYPTAVTQTILGIALFLLAISWLWSPLAGFSGLGRIWERHLQNIGTPFEHWLSELDELSRTQKRPEDFMRAAADKLVELPWVAGAQWSAATGTGEAGEPSRHALTARIQDLELTLFGRRNLGGVLYLHANLLLQVIGHFHSAKQRELESSQNAHIQAIYETGARVTHDIKNLLQSLQGLSVAVEHNQGRDPAGVQALIERQLPHITQRLQLALDKLQTPDGDHVVEGDVERWWDVLRMRNQGQGIEFTANIDRRSRAPIELFDSVVENLLENARAKRQVNPALNIRVALEITDTTIAVYVSDDGEAVPSDIAAQLFKGAVASRNGLGIGLYQAARQAQRLGFKLSLTENSATGVKFELIGPVIATDPAAPAAENSDDAPA